MRITILYVLLVLVPAAGRAETVTIPAPDGTALRAELDLPRGQEVAPAIVMLHGCGGAARAHGQWARLLTGAGHVVLAPDSFGSRGLGPQCRVRPGERTAAAETVRRGDALAAAAWLAARPETPPGGVVIMGWSDGGSTVLAAARPAPDLPAGLVRGFVAFYPACREMAKLPGWRPAAPLLILSGEADRRTPIAICRTLAARAPQVKLVPFADAGHMFDAPRPASRRAADGDAAARQAVLVQVPEWITSLPAAR